MRNLPPGSVFICPDPAPAHAAARLSWCGGGYGTVQYTVLPAGGGVVGRGANGLGRNTVQPARARDATMSAATASSDRVSDEESADGRSGPGMA